MSALQKKCIIQQVLPGFIEVYPILNVQGNDAVGCHHEVLLTSVVSQKENCKEFFFYVRGSRCIVCWRGWYWNCSTHRSHVKPTARSRSYINVAVIHTPVFCQKCRIFPCNGAILHTGPYPAFLSHTHFRHLTEQQALAEQEN